VLRLDGVFCCFLLILDLRSIYLIKRCATPYRRAGVLPKWAVVFCTVVLITGPIWARPVWGIWWTWDMRLTSDAGAVADLRELFVSAGDFLPGGQTPLLAAALAVLGALCVPFVYFSICFPDPASAAVMGEEDRSIRA